MYFSLEKYLSLRTFHWKSTKTTAHPLTKIPKGIFKVSSAAEAILHGVDVFRSTNKQDCFSFSAKYYYVFIVGIM